MTVVLVTGSRDWRDLAMVFRVLSQYGPDTVLVHGAQRGADRHADAYGKYRQWEVHPEPADWLRYHRAAGPIRNRRMLDLYKPDVVHAFHDDLDNSKGTADCVSQARARGIPVAVHKHDRPLP